MEISRDIKSSFDLWSGVPQADLVADICDVRRSSLQLDSAWSAPAAQQLLQNDALSATDQLMSFETAELLAIIQQQQLLLSMGTASADECDIDAQIQRLVLLKQYLKRTNQAAVPQQQQQTIMEDTALPQDVLSLLSVSAAFSAPSVDLAQPLPSDSGLLDGASDLDNGWGHLSAARAAARARAVRHSLDVGALAHSMATARLDLGRVPSAGLSDSQQGLDLNLAGLVDSFTSNLGSTGIHCLGGNSFTEVTSAFQGAPAAPSSNSFCGVPAPTLANLLDVTSSGLGTSTPPLPSPESMAANTKLALQSAFYGSSTTTSPSLPAAAGLADAAGNMSTALSAPSPVALCGLPSVAGMPPALSVPPSMPMPSRQSIDCSNMGLQMRQSIDCSNMGLQMRQSIDCSGMAMSARQSLDYSNLLGSSVLPPAGPVSSGMPSPSTGAFGRPSLNLPQAPMGDLGAHGRGGHTQQAESADGGWNFTGRRGRASQDVKRVSSDLMRSQTPTWSHPPPRKSISSLTTVSSSSSGGSGNNSGRSSPRSRQQQQGSGAAGGPNRASMDKPNVQAPKWANGTQWNPMAAVPKAGQAGNKGTGVFIPTSMIKS